MFIGIKNTKINPVLLKVLPSGVAVYRSVFKDIWGSDIIRCSLMVTRVYLRKIVVLFFILIILADLSVLKKQKTRRGFKSVNTTLGHMRLG